MKRTVYYPEYTQNNLEKYRRLLPPKRHIDQPLVYMEMGYDGGAFTTELYLDPLDERQMLIPYESRTEQSVALNSIGLHSHDFYELFIVASGTLKIRMGASLREFHTGEVCLLDKNTLHVELFESDANLVYLGIADSLFPYLSEQTGGKAFVPRSIISDFFARNLGGTQSQRSEYLIFVPRGESSILPLILDVAARMRSRRISSKAYILADVLELFELLCDPDCYEGSRVALDDYPFISISEIIKRMIDERNGMISVQEISSRLNYNTTYVSRILKKHTGLTTKQYCQLCQMNLLKKRILETDESISALIKQMGFENKTQVYRVFKRVYGCTPHEYRQMALETAPKD